MVAVDVHEGLETQVGILKNGRSTKLTLDLLLLSYS